MDEAVRRELAAHAGARSGALRRALPPCLAHLPDRLRGNVPQHARAHAPLPDRVQQAESRAGWLPDEPRVPVRRRPDRRVAPWRATGTPTVATRCWRRCAPGPLRLRKETSNLFRTRAPHAGATLDARPFHHVLAVDPTAGFVDAE